MDKIRYRLGLDIGITSVGWCIVNLDKNRIEDLGVRIFNIAEDPETGASLALPRRMARGRRRLLRRKAYRVDRVRKLILDNNILNKKELDNLYMDKTMIGPWEARIEGLDRVLTNEELAKILINFVKRRGFKSNRKNEAKDKEAGVILKSIQENREKMIESNARTIGEYIFKSIKDSEDSYKALRNKNGNYNMCISRDMIREEIDFIFDRQRTLGNDVASNELETAYLEIFDSQRPYSDFDLLEKFVGNCTFEKSLKRAPKHCITAEEFVLYESINKLSIILDGTKRRLTNDERESIVNEAMSKKELKYSSLRKLLNLSDEERFSALTYSIDKDYTKTENTKFVSMKAYYEIKKAIEYGAGKEQWNKIKNDRVMLNDIAYILTLGKTDEEIKKQLLVKNVSEDIVNAVVEDLSFSQFLNLSITAMEKLIPFMKMGCQYNEACEKAGYDFKNIYKGEKSKKLPVIDIEEIVNPVVKRALAQTRKVINSVIEIYGSPVGINIELARELAKNFKDRKNIEKEQKQNRDNREKYREKIKELFNREATPIEILKYRLWEEQKQECAYTSCSIGINDLFSPGYCEIDHIIPHSRSFDDSLSNKVLVLCRENQNKANRTPFEYFGNDDDRWNRFEIWVKASKLAYKKKQNLLKKKISDDEKSSMKQRNIQDTKYICTYISNYINNRLEFAESESKQKVITVNGRATAYLRTRWGLNKVREDGDKHHALDAAVVAVTTQGMVNKISLYSKAHELEFTRKSDEYVDPETGEVVTEFYREELKDIFPRPWRGFSEELKMRLSENPLEELINSPIKSYDEQFIKETVRPLFVSRMPIRKVKGRLFKETVYSKKAFKDNVIVTKKKLIDLKKADLDNIYNYNCDKFLHDAIIAKMQESNNDAKKAFAEEFRKPTKSGRLGPVVKSIKIQTAVHFKDGIEVKNIDGLVAKDGMVRVDVYYKNKKYYTVPVYRCHIASGKMPKKAVVARKSESEWINLDETYDFKFSIFKNDLIEIKYEKENKQGFFGYYVKFNRANETFTLDVHDRSYKSKSTSTKTGVKEFNKYEVDILGRYHKVREGNK